MYPFLLKKMRWLWEVSKTWIIDSAATSHMCNNKELFAELKPLHPPANIAVGDGSTIECHGIGMVRLCLETVDNSIVTRCNVQKVLYVPGLEYNLLSVSKLVKGGKIWRFEKDW